MKNLWMGLACLVVLGVAGYMMLQSEGGDEWEVGVPREEVALIVAEEKAKVEALKAELAELRAKLDRLESAALIALDAPEVAVASLDDADSVEASEAEIEPEEPALKEEKKNPMAAVAHMFSGEKGKKMAKASANMQVGMMYDEYLTQLDESVRGPLRDVIVDHLANMMTSMADVAAEGLDGKKMKTFQKDSEASLRDTVAEYLTPEELEAWDAYSEEMPVRMLKRQMEMQLSMGASSLSAEERETVAETIAEEVIAGQAVADASDSSDVMGDALSVQREAYASAQERLLDYLTPAQQEDLDRVLTQQLEMMDGVFAAMSSEE